MTLAPDIAISAKGQYDREGWYQAPTRFSAEDMAKLRASVEAISAQTRPEVVYEKGTEAVRAIHGCHAFDEVCARLVRLPQLVRLAEELVGGPVYVYQFKVNLKQPHEGAAWPWHQDFAFWEREDSMLTDNAVNIAILLDDVHEENGPLKVIPGSHLLGLIDEDTKAAARSGDWTQHVSADLEHTVPATIADRLAEEHGTRLVVGEPGSYYAFHPTIVHSSTDNRSPDRRALLLITYNSVSNAPVAPARPEFLVSRDATPVTALEPGAQL
ncbi:phytanoyl-CoA dioxygenase family protein [Streptomyces sp. NPDC093097]|uniref:phytanoyl-CoA dioxygenase family protein n=1 Tax=Streptomyces sp. NPDC093097 TaxID=3366027 RepID=UPI00380A9B6F